MQWNERARRFEWLAKAPGPDACPYRQARITPLDNNQQPAPLQEDFPWVDMLNAVAWVSRATRSSWAMAVHRLHRALVDDEIQAVERHLVASQWVQTPLTADFWLEWELQPTKDKSGLDTIKFHWSGKLHLAREEEWKPSLPNIDTWVENPINPAPRFVPDLRHPSFRREEPIRPAITKSVPTGIDVHTTLKRRHWEPPTNIAGWYFFVMHADLEKRWPDKATEVPEATEATEESTEKPTEGMRKILCQLEEIAPGRGPISGNRKELAKKLNTSERQLYAALKWRRDH